jgi:hypothetical protein
LSICQLALRLNQPTLWNGSGFDERLYPSDLIPRSFDK